MVAEITQAIKALEACLPSLSAKGTKQAREALSGLRTYAGNKPELYEKLYSENKDMRDDLCRLDRIRDEQKRQAGFNTNVSFDVVWQQMLDVWNDHKAAQAHLDGIKEE